MQVQNLSAEHKNEMPLAPNLVRPSWYCLAMGRIRLMEFRYIKPIKNNVLQDKLDLLGREIEARFVSIKAQVKWNEFNRALNAHSDSGDWLKDLAVELCKLPIKTAVKLLEQLCHFVKSALYFAAHPLHGTAQLARDFVHLAYMMTQPGVWANFGIGMLGATIGSAIMLGSVSKLCLIVGTIALLAGLFSKVDHAAAQAYQAEIDRGQGQQLAMQAWNRAAKGELRHLFPELAQSFVDGLLLSILVGFIQRKMIQTEKIRFDANTWDKTKEFIDQYLKDHNLPREYSGWAIDSKKNNLHIYFEKPEHLSVMQNHPILAKEIRELAANPAHPGFKPINIEVVLGPNERVAIHAHSFWGRGPQYDVVAYSTKKLLGNYVMPTAQILNPVFQPSRILKLAHIPFSILLCLKNATQLA